MTVGSLFAGIGGFDLGFERAGFEIKWQCEIDPFCRAVLAQHWPDVRRYEDVRDVHGADTCWTKTDDECEWPCGLGCLDTVDVLCGGFPCQDISTAGAGAGIDGERSGLWREYARLIGELRPRYVVVENVAALLVRGLGRVLGDLAALGYDAEWDCLPASAFGAPHRRDRVWIVAYPAGGVRQRPASWQAGHVALGGEDVADASGLQSQRWRECAGVDAVGYSRARAVSERPEARTILADADDRRQLQPQGRIFNERGRFGDGRWWLVEPDVGRVAHGVSARVDRLRGLGNAIIPQISEWIARQILKAER